MNMVDLHANRTRATSATFHELLIYAASHPAALVIAELARRLGSVVYTPGIGYLVSDAEIVRSILQQDTRFSKTGPGSMGPIVTQLIGPFALLNMDGEPHRELRARLGDLFSPQYLESLVQRAIDPAVSELEHALTSGCVVDLVRFAHRLTGGVTCRMLGIPVAAGAEDRTYEDIFRLGEQLVSFVGLSTRSISYARLQQQRMHFERLIAYARAGYEDPSAMQSDSISQRLRLLGLTFEEAQGVIGVLFLVGMVTVSTALPRICALMIETGQLKLLRQGPEFAPAAIDEGLRYTMPVPAIARSVEVDSWVEGHRFRAGRRVVLFLYNAFKDPRVFPRPRDFDITRTSDPRIRHLWFGAGPHFCLGFGLAHRELGAVLNMLPHLPGELRIVRRQYARNVLIPAYRTLEVRLER
jgi:cytochrome P450